MLDSSVEGLGRRVLRKAEDLATADAGQPAGPGDQQEAQGPHAPQDVRVGPFARAAAGRGDGVELEAARVFWMESRRSRSSCFDSRS